MFLVEIAELHGAADESTTGGREEEAKEIKMKSDFFTR